MRYGNVVKGEFIERPNRFIATVKINGIFETVHVKNTGRCRELLIPGVTVYLSEAENEARKTKYDLIAVEKKRENDSLLINIDSQAPNDAAEEWFRKTEFFGKNAVIRREKKFKNSRFDFYIETDKRKIFLEVKGCTLENDGVAAFPDAPTERGRKHVAELSECLKSGYEAYLLFVIQMKGMRVFTPNDKTDIKFGDELRLANKNGVHIYAVDCIITPDTIAADALVPVAL